MAKESQKGFTLMEILVVIGLLTIVGSLSLIVSMDDYREYSFRNDRDVIISVLQKARSQAMNNVCYNYPSYTCIDGKPHGVRFQMQGGTLSYTIFQGANWVARDSAVDEVFKARSAATVMTGATPADFVFSQLSGTSTAGSIIIKDANDGSGHELSTITIGSEGRIAWTN